MVQADILVNLSTCRESFGRSVLEGMASRLPVVAFAWGALPELVRDGETGYLVPFGDLATAAQRIECLCRDRALRKTMGEAGRRVAEQGFSPFRLAKALRSSYRAILPSQTARQAAASDLTITLPCVNNSQFSEPFYVENRARFAHCTGVKLIDEHRLVCTSLIGQRMYLLRFDMRARTYAIEACIQTQDGSKDVSTDLLDFNGGKLLLTSNCEHRSVSIYRLTENGIVFVEAISIDDGDAGYCHGAKFVPGRPDLVCVTSITRGRHVSFISLETRRVVYRINDESWLSKDVCCVTPRLMVVVATRESAGENPSPSSHSKISLIAVNQAFDGHQVLHEVVCEGAQFDGCHVVRGVVYVTDQARDVVQVFHIRGDRLESAEDLEGFSFPHGIDVSADGNILAVSNYGPNTVTLRRLSG
jgi:hypothetical protein